MRFPIFGERQNGENRTKKWPRLERTALSSPANHGIDPITSLGSGCHNFSLEYLTRDRSIY